ncbi:PadR family transcriptional regulator [Candidatus Woesearchaeota archaeon]|nr:PadR family transcriptional regulator [Candidatus Woesearchaeota archaeon]
MRSCCNMRGFLAFTVLRLVSKRGMSGEAIRKELEIRRGSKPSPGTIYPVLKSLSESGWIRETGNGRKEKKYAITPLGRRVLGEATRKFVAMFCDMKEDFEKARSR